MTQADRAFARLLIAWLALAAGPAASRADNGDPVRGERQFQRCYSCHSVEPGETAKLQGPSLYRVIGRRAGTLPGFEYTPAMIAKGKAGLVWDAASLDTYLADPEAMVQGTSMNLPPLRDEKDRADIVAYLAAAARR